MKKYDLPAIHRDGTVAAYLPIETTSESVIVLTIEELREVWDKGYVRGCDEAQQKYIDQDFYSASPSFNDYLKSKGIEI